MPIITSHNRSYNHLRVFFAFFLYGDNTTRVPLHVHIHMLLQIPTQTQPQPETAAAVSTCKSPSHACIHLLAARNVYFTISYFICLFYTFDMVSSSSRPLRSG